MQEMWRDGVCLFKVNPTTGAIETVQGEPYSPGGGGPHTHTIANVTDLQTTLDGKAASSHAHTEANVTGLTAALAAKQATSEKAQANGYASLGADGKVPSAQLPAAALMGYALMVDCINQATTTDAQTIYWGSKNLAHQTVAAIHRIYIPKAGTIKVCYAHFNAGTAGTGENWSLYIRLNNTTDTLVQTLGSTSADRVFSNTGLSIAVVAGDYIELKEVQPTWATNPANVRRSAVIYIE